MQYSLLRESRVVVIHDGRAYEFDALSNVSASIDYTEYKSNRKTLHKKRNYPLSKVTAKNTTSISLAVNLTDNLLEANFYRWLGLKEFGGFFYLPDSSDDLEPQYVEIYIISKGSIFNAKICYVSAVDFTLEKNVPLLNIAIESANCSEVNDYPLSASILQGNILTYSPLRIQVNNNEMPGVQGASVSLQQQCNWREQRTIHDLGTIYTHKKAIVSEMNASATINFNLVHRVFGGLITEYPQYNVPVVIFNSHLAINFPSARITKRLTVSDIYTAAFDIIPMEYDGDPVTIKFFGENND